MAVEWVAKADLAVVAADSVVRLRSQAWEWEVDLAVVVVVSAVDLMLAKGIAAVDLEEVSPVVWGLLAIRLRTMADLLNWSTRSLEEDQRSLIARIT